MAAPEQKLSARSIKHLNPTALNRMHVIVQIGGVWESLYLELDTLKGWVLEDLPLVGNGFIITKLNCYDGTTEIYQADQYEQIQQIIFKGGGSTTTIKITDDYTDETLIETCNDTLILVNKIYTSTEIAERKMNILIEGADSQVTIISMKNL